MGTPLENAKQYYLLCKGLFYCVLNCSEKLSKDIFNMLTELEILDY
jgi:hypothetical protein